MWQERIAPRDGGEKMKGMDMTKVGIFLVISSVLAGWTLLATQPVQAHVYNTVTAPSCSDLPTAAGFFSATETAAIATSDTDLTPDTKQGTTATHSGNTNYRYAKITIPAIAAGELRVFDTRTRGDVNVSAATLCRGSTRIESYTKSYDARTHTSGHTGDAAEDEHAVFQIRAEVSPDDEEYIVVIDSEDPATNPASIAVDFNGVISHAGNNNKIRDSFTGRGQQYAYQLNVTANGLLTVQTTGSTDTKGRLDKTSVTTGSIATADGGGSGGNFKIVVPVVSGADYTVIVEGQTLDTRGAYTLDLDFKVAVGNVTDRNTPVTTGVSALENVGSPPVWASTGFAADDTTLQLVGGSDEDYFFLTLPGNVYELLTIQTQKVSGASNDPNTKGTLYGPTGEITSDDNSGEANRHFLIETPVGPGHYVVQVTGTAGPYGLDFDSEAANKIAAIPSVSLVEDDDATNLEIEAPTGSDPLNDYYHMLDIQSPGALYVHTTGSTDTVGFLYGPDGRELDTDDDSGKDMNFRLSANVQAGLHLVLVQGKTRTTAGAYSLVVNLIEGEELPPGVDPTDPGECPDGTEPVETDEKGVLENPSGGGYRSGIGVISGWVCAANAVEVRILNERGVLQRTLAVAYGTSRPDTVGQCRGHRSPDTGFGMTYNFNHLPQGIYRIRAYADGEPIGQEERFEVVHLREFADSDTQRFLEDLPEGECIVPDFPMPGERTWLRWEQSTQNFVIDGVR